MRFLLIPHRLILCVRLCNFYPFKPSLSESEAKAYVFVGEKENGTMRKSARIINESFKNSELKILPRAYHGQFSINHALSYVKTILEITKDT